MFFFLAVTLKFNTNYEGCLGVHFGEKVNNWGKGSTSSAVTTQIVKKQFEITGMKIVPNFVWFGWGIIFEEKHHEGGGLSSIFL